MLKLALVNAAKDNGKFVKPNVADFNSVNKLNAIASDDDPHKVTPKGYAGESFVAGELYAGNYDTEANRFAGDLEAVPADKLPGTSTPKSVRANNDGSITE